MISLFSANTVCHCHRHRTRSSDITVHHCRKSELKSPDIFLISAAIPPTLIEKFNL